MSFCLKTSTTSSIHLGKGLGEGHSVFVLVSKRFTSLSWGDLSIMISYIKKKFVEGYEFLKVNHELAAIYCAGIVLLAFVITYFPIMTSRVIKSCSSPYAFVVVIGSLNLVIIIGYMVWNTFEWIRYHEQNSKCFLMKKLLPKGASSVDHEDLDSLDVDIDHDSSPRSWNDISGQESSTSHSTATLSKWKVKCTRTCGIHTCFIVVISESFLI